MKGQETVSGGIMPFHLALQEEAGKRIAKLVHEQALVASRPVEVQVVLTPCSEVSSAGITGKRQGLRKSGPRVVVRFSLGAGEEHTNAHLVRALEFR